MTTRQISLWCEKSKLNQLIIKVEIESLRQISGILSKYQFRNMNLTILLHWFLDSSRQISSLE